ncbi:hypothetical protein ABZT27_24390 [Streptomyces sp. NPDC005389]|uniref:hypothetical protein n=1 Tax=Streptomyces sp. NPDC005389 TaxID=3157040 RepID=UPI0033A8F232
MAQDESDDWIRRETGGRVRRLPLGLDGSADLVGQRLRHELIPAGMLPAAWAP